MVKMTHEDREYFKNGAKALCGIELIAVIGLVEDKDFIKSADSGDLKFMKKALGMRAGEIWAEILRALSKRDIEEVKKILRGGTGE